MLTVETGTQLAYLADSPIPIGLAVGAAAKFTLVAGFNAVSKDVGLEALCEQPRVSSC